MIPVQLKTAFILAVIVAIIATLFSLSGIINSPFYNFIVMLTKDHAVIGLGTLMAHTYLVFQFSRPRLFDFLLVLNAGLIFTIGFFYFYYDPTIDYWYNIAVFFSGLGFSTFILSIFKLSIKKSSADHIPKYILWHSLIILIMAKTVDSELMLSAAIHPTTYDWAAYIIDQTLGFNPDNIFAPIIVPLPVIGYISDIAYFLLPFGYSVLLGLQLSRNKRTPVNIATIIVVSGICAITIYLICPVTGPLYAFGDALFPHNLPAIDDLQKYVLINPFAPRNGVPSMHFAWALLFWINSRPYSRAIKGFFTASLVFNFIATLASGEHYLIDLVVAVPVVLFIQALCTFPIAELQEARKKAIFTGVLLTLFWIIAIRYGTSAFLYIPGFSWLAVIATVVLTIKYCKPLLKILDVDTHALESSDKTDGSGITVKNVISPYLFVCGLFFISGFAALVYQVLFSKILTHTFGSTATATYTVLATYMGGMAIGAWLGGKIISVRREPLIIYALCEMVIAIYCYFTPGIFDFVQHIYVLLGTGYSADVIALHASRFFLGVIVLLVPTVLMGMTLPVLVSHFQRYTRSIGVSVAHLYSSNTIGAAFGALLGGYLIIPALGITNTIHISVWLNIFAAGVAYILSSRTVTEKTSVPTEVPEITKSSAEFIPLYARQFGIIAISILCISGIVSLGIEVIYVHLLSIVAGNSVYAFSLMLFVFLIGLGIGSEFGRLLLKFNEKIVIILSFLQFCLVASLLTGVFLWERIPDYFASFYGYPLATTFGAREFIRALVCFIAMFPPAFFIGAFYPLCLNFIGNSFDKHRIEIIGGSIALNTLGNIVGVLAVGFIILPNFGVLTAVQILSFIAFLLGCTFILLIKQNIKIPVTFAIILIVLFILQPGQFNYEKLASGANVYFSKRDWGPVIDHAESLDGGLTTVHELDKNGREEKVRFLLTNGKFQGADELSGEMAAQIGFAVAPMLHTSERESALVIGYGTGTTARVIHDAGFQQIDIVDLSKDIVDMANKYFEASNNGVTNKKGVSTTITDGRNFLMLSSRDYDLITVEISSIWFAGAATLYNKEFYTLVNQHLKETGVFQQWVQLHHIHPVDLLYIIGTLRSSFRYVWLYLIGGQGILVATDDVNARPTDESMSLLDNNKNLDILMDLYGGSSERLLENILLAPEEIDSLIFESNITTSVPVSTDDNVVLEYNTPRGNVLDSAKSFKQNINWLKKFKRN